MKTTRILVLVVSVFVAEGAARAQENLSRDLRIAQKAMAAGDYQKAYSEYLKVANKKDNALAQFSVGLFYHMGWGRPVAPAKAYIWFDKAARGGIPAAQHFLGDFLVEGVHCKADPTQAAQWYRKAADGGHYLSLCSLAELYMSGNGVDKDPNQAIELCTQAAQKASIPAQIRLGRFFLEGDPPVRDYEQAYYWFKQAAHKNAAEAQYYLGVMLREGLGPPKDLVLARDWFEHAASRKYLPAYLPAGELYLYSPVDPNTGKLSAHDLAKSYLWLTAASRQVSDPNDVGRVKTLLDRVQEIVPAHWKPDLDAKVDAHFAAAQ